MFEAIQTLGYENAAYRSRRRFRAGVADGTRTRDSQDHNLVLYQLNYSHHCRVKRRERS